MEIGGKTTLVSTFIVNLIVSGALNYLWSMVNCLQIVAHYPLINVLMPANCKDIFRVVVMIATFDMLPIEGIMEWLDLSEFTETYEKPMPDNFKEFGYQHSDPIQNLEMVFLVIVGLLMLPPLL